MCAIQHTDVMDPSWGIIATTLQRLLTSDKDKGQGGMRTACQADYTLALQGIWEADRGVKVSPKLKKERQSVMFVLRLLQGLCGSGLVASLSQRFDADGKKRLGERLWSVCQQTRMMVDGVVGSGTEAREKGKAILKDSQARGGLDLALWRVYMMVEAATGGREEALRIGKMALGLLAQVMAVYNKFGNR